jgi:hypothetical protein
MLGLDYLSSPIAGYSDTEEPREDLSFNERLFGSVQATPMPLAAAEASGLGPLSLAVPAASSGTQRPVLKKAHQKTAAGAEASLNRGSSMASTSQGRAGHLSLRLKLTTPPSLVIPPFETANGPRASPDRCV